MAPFVFIRLDKIGDLALSLEVDQHPALAGKVFWLISAGLGVIPSHGIPPRNFLELSSHPSDWRSSYGKLVQLLREKKPKAVVIFQAPWWVSLACWRAKVPKRVGRLSQWHSFLFLNHGIRQARSLSEKHEAQYNLDLVLNGLLDDLSFHQDDFPSSQKPLPLRLKVDTDHQWLGSLSLKWGEYVVIHPGMFGSALNWPSTRYNELIGDLKQDQPVVVTGTTMDEPFLRDIKEKWGKDPRVLILQNKVDLFRLLHLLSGAKWVLAPSTGVLHLAAALGKKTVGIYSPILAHHPRRWGPLGPRSSYLLPNVICPAKTECLGEKCSYFPCMSSISSSKVLKFLQKESSESPFE